MFDPMKELKAIKEQRSVARRKRYQESKLSKYCSELLELRKAGASYVDLALWLRTQRRMRVQPSSIQRFLRSIQGTREESGDGSVQ